MGSSPRLNLDGKAAKNFCQRCESAHANGVTWDGSDGKRKVYWLEWLNTVSTRNSRLKALTESRAPLRKSGSSVVSSADQKAPDSGVSPDQHHTARDSISASRAAELAARAPVGFDSRSIGELKRARAD